MSNELKQKRWYVTDDNINYIQDFKELNAVGDDSVALRLILKEHKELKNHLFDLNYISESIKSNLITNVNQIVSNSLQEELKRIRLGTNNTDRNTQILIELIQGWMVLSNVDMLSATENYKPDFLTFVENVVKNRITHQKQKKDAAKV